MADNTRNATSDELLSFAESIDQIVEQGLAKRLRVERLCAEVLPRLCAAAGAQAAALRTFSEQLTVETFHWPRTPTLSLDALPAHLDHVQSPCVVPLSGGTLLAQPLIVAQARVGAAGLWFAGTPSARAEALLGVVAEELDGFLFLLREARTRHEVIVSLGEALRQRALSDGLQQAAAQLFSASALGGLVVSFQLSQDTKPRVYSFRREEQRAAPFTASSTEPRDALAALGCGDLYEEPLEDGSSGSQVTGRVVAGAAPGTLSIYEQELVGGFCLLLRQRLSGFAQEWRRLAASFSAEATARLLEQDDYETRYLAPHEQQVAMLYADIAGFTRISEQTLRTPERVGALIERWSYEVVRRVWAHGGVFDKMVGDCVIALFGPPFYEAPPGERLRRALLCAQEIRALTRALPASPEFAHLAQEGLGVATGVHLAPLFAGCFGPNQNFTGFSSGMNNTARLQGCATRDEILVMEEALAQLPEGLFRFGPPRQARVKNVAAPLFFRALLDPGAEAAP